MIPMTLIAYYADFGCFDVKDPRKSGKMSLETKGLGALPDYMDSTGCREMAHYGIIEPYQCTLYSTSF